MSKKFYSAFLVGFILASLAVRSCLADLGARQNQIPRFLSASIPAGIAATLSSHRIPSRNLVSLRDFRAYYTIAAQSQFQGPAFFLINPDSEWHALLITYLLEEKGAGFNLMRRLEWISRLLKNPLSYPA